MTSKMWFDIMNGVLSNYAGNGLAQLTGQALNRLQMVIELENDMKKVESNVSAMQASIADAQECLTKNNLSKDALEKTEEALYYAEDVLDEFSTDQALCKLKTGGNIEKMIENFFSSSNPLAFKFKLAHKIKKFKEKLKEIYAERATFGFIENFGQRTIQWEDLSHQIPTHSAIIEEEVVGREGDKMRLKRLLLDMEDVKHNNVSFIAIVGMGGIGKTTLAKLLYNDTELSNYFDLKMWVCVSDQFEVKRVVQKMIESASGSKPNVQEMDSLRCELYQVIGGKKYLLVMDDMWDESEEKWEQLKPLLMVGARGSKILITKRDSIAPAEVGRMTKFIELKGLSDDDSLSLFKQVALKEGMEIANPKMIQLEKEILKKCGGVPLLIRGIGRMVYSKSSKEDSTSFNNDELHDADDVLDKFSTEAPGGEVMTTLNNILERELKIIWERVDEIIADINKFGLNVNSKPRIQLDGLSFHQMGTPSNLNVDEVIGRDVDKVHIKSLLLNLKNHDVSFLAITGISGIGKTTLAKLLYNDSEVSKHFDLKLWVGISDQFEVKRVVEKMIESASGSKLNVQETNFLHVKLQKVIGGKKYLLVMDDVWDESGKKWEELKPLLKGGARGSKILITMCNRTIPAEVESMTELINLEGLSDNSSWSLFEKVAFREFRNPNMKQLGKEILEKCGGVPLVIKLIGHVLYSNFSEKEWISIKNDELLKITRENNYDMGSIFKLSYQHLPSHLKQCFAYSSLYTKHDSITKDELIRQWVAHGFVKSSGESKSIEDIASEYFTELCWRFFYEHHDDNSVHMHDMMRHLATTVAGTRYVCGNLKDVGEKTRHFKLCHTIKSWNDLKPELRKVKGLRTLRMPGMESINEEDLDKILSNYPRLRVLDLSGGNIKMVPNSLKNLKHLRYLDLSKNLSLQSLPNFIGELVNLQTLDLNGCKALTQLPREINNLVNLRHLVLKLTCMPIGIGKLTCLQTLSLFVLDENNQGSKLGELNGLKDLRGGLYIKGLEKSRDNSSEANLKDKKSLRDVILQWNRRSEEDETDNGENDEFTLEGLELHPNVESVYIWWYNGGRLPNWVANPMSKLNYISLAMCNRLQKLPQFDQLPALTRLDLDGLTSLQFIDCNNAGSSSSSSTSVFFPSLRILNLKSMPDLEGWWKGESRVLVGDEESEKRRDLLPQFARLTELSICDCPKLRWVPRQPSLRVMELNKVGAWMVGNIGPSLNLEYLTLENIEDLESLPTETCSLRIIKLKIWNCPNFQKSSVPPFLSVDYGDSANDEQPITSQ